MTEAICSKCKTALRPNGECPKCLLGLSMDRGRLRGETLGHFKLGTLIGWGGMGEVYHATDLNLDREVAVKVFSEQFTTQSGFEKRMKTEARLLAKISHPNVATIYSFEVTDSKNLLVLELVRGYTLGQTLSVGRIDVKRALEIMIQVARGLESAHGRGIVHRDLKPENIKIDPEGGVKILDFGLAKFVHFLEPELSHGLEGTAKDQEDTADLESDAIAIDVTDPGTVLGTVPYMSPEQSRGEDVDTRTDIWSFGCVLFEILARVRPFSGESVEQLLGMIRTREPDWGLLPIEIPQSVRTLIRRCLTKDSEEPTPRHR